MSSLNLNGLKCTVELDIAADVAEKVRQKKIEELKKNVQVPGYRPNKVPNSYIVNRFGEELNKDVMEEVVGGAFRDLLGEHKVVPAHEPKETIESKEIGKPIKLRYEFECLPKFELLDKEKMDLKRPVVEITAAMVDKEIKTLQKEYPLWKATKAAAKEGDRIKISYKCKVDGEPFNNNELMKAEAVIGKETLYPELESQLVGLKSGEEKNVKVTFKSDYPNPSLAGKPAEFDVTVTEVEKGTVTDVDEAFVERALGQKKSVEAFREDIKANVDKQVQGMLEIVMVDRLQMLLDEAYDFPLPETLFKNEIAARAENKEEDEKAKILALPMDSDDIHVQNVNRALRLGLVAAQYSEDNNIDVSEKELADFIIAFASNSGNSQEFLKWFIEDERRVMDARNRLLHQKSVEGMIAAYAKDGEKMTMKALEELVKETQSKEV